MSLWRTDRCARGLLVSGCRLLGLTALLISLAAPARGLAAPSVRSVAAGVAVVTGQAARGQASATAGGAASTAVPFTSDRWRITAGYVLEYMGRECLEGTAVLDDVEFVDGTIEVDIAMTGRRSYPGVVFRVRPGGEFERFYIRPHRAGLYSDAMQYTPTFHNIAGWQLYNGHGYTAGVEIEPDTWVPVRIEVQGREAQVFVGDVLQPQLEITDLKHGVSSGGIGLLGPANGTACFSNFRYEMRQPSAAPSPDNAGPRPGDPPEGTVLDWQISRVLPAAQIDRSAYPRFFAIFMAQWQDAPVEPSGLVDISRLYGRSGPAPDLVFARTFVNAEERQDIELQFGYSDEVDVFLNGKKVFSAANGYQYRDPSALGIVGLYDRLNLTLEKGVNEVFVMVTESFGGWALMARADRDLGVPAKDHGRLEKVWETERELLTPESVQYDPRREVLYVSSFDVNYANTPEHTGYISKVGLDGTIVEHDWISDLDAPTGLGILNDRLYVLERGFLTEIDIDAGEVAARHEIPDSDFLNDLAIGPDGSIYMTDTRPSSHADSRVFRFHDGEVEVWLDGPEVVRANGLWVHGNELLLGNTGDGSLKAVDLTSKQVRKIVTLGAGVVDGIRVDRDGNYLVSHWEGQVYVVSPDGQAVEILDTLPEATDNTADFEFIAEHDLLLIPTFLGNRVVAYRLRASGAEAIPGGTR